jgi:hypothetical protein
MSNRRNEVPEWMQSLEWLEAGRREDVKLLSEVERVATQHPHPEVRKLAKELCLAVILSG